MVIRSKRPGDRFLFRGPTLCTAKVPMILGLLLGLAVAVVGIAIAWR